MAVQVLGILLLATVGCSQKMPIGRVTAETLNVRSGPALGADSIGRLGRGSQVEILGTDRDRTHDGAAPGLERGWYRIRFEGKTGYVAAAYVDVTEPERRPSATWQFIKNCASACWRTIVWLYGLTRAYLLTILVWGGLVLGGAGLAYLVVRRVAAYRVQRLLDPQAGQTLPGPKFKFELRTRGVVMPPAWVRPAMIIVCLAFFVSILLPAVTYGPAGQVVHNTYGIFTLAGGLLVRTFGLSLYALLPFAVWRFFRLQYDSKFLVATFGWLIFVEAARGPEVPPPLIGGIVDAPFMVAFGRADLLAGAILFVAIVWLLALAKRQHSPQSQQVSLSGGRTEPDMELEKEVLSALVNLGYPRKQARRAFASVEPNPAASFDDVLRETLQVLGR